MGSKEEFREINYQMWSKMPLLMGQIYLGWRMWSLILLVGSGIANDVSPWVTWLITARDRLDAGIVLNMAINKNPAMSGLPKDPLFGFQKR